MNELEKLLENAGITESFTAGSFDTIEREASDMLDSLSGGQYEFQVLQSGKIEVFAEVEDGMRMFARFDDFNHMLDQFGKL